LSPITQYYQPAPRQRPFPPSTLNAKRVRQDKPDNHNTASSSDVTPQSSQLSTPKGLRRDTGTSLFANIILIAIKAPTTNTNKHTEWKCADDVRNGPHGFAPIPKQKIYTKEGGISEFHVAANTEYTCSAEVAHLPLQGLFPGSVGVVTPIMATTSAQDSRTKGSPKASPISPDRYHQ
jgi:hypothetical protein